MMTHLMRKTLVKIAGTFLVVTAIFFPWSANNPSTTNAQFGGTAFEVNPAVLAPLATVAAAQISNETRESILDGLAWTVAKVAIDSITRSTVNWINSGFNGSPAFVSDLKENLTYLGDAIAEDFFVRLDQNIIANTGFSIRTPFQDQLNQKLREEFYRTTSSYGLDYTLDAYSENPKAYIDGNFSQGGFDAFFALSQNQSNNPLGAYVQAQNRLWAEIGAAQQQRRQELDWGRGFLSFRGPCAVAGQATDLSRAEKCAFNSVRTPGSVIEDQLTTTLGSGVRQLELADNFNEIVGSLIGQLANQVLGSGGLSGVSNPSSGGGRSYLERATDGSGQSASSVSLAQGALNNMDMERERLQEFERNLSQMRSIVIDAQARCTNSTEIAEELNRIDSALSRSNSALTELDRLSQQIEAAIENSRNDSTAVRRAVTAYEAFLSSASVPATSETSRVGSDLLRLQDRMDEIVSSCRR